MSLLLSSGVGDAGTESGIGKAVATVHPAMTGRIDSDRQYNAVANLGFLEFKRFGTMMSDMDSILCVLGTLCG